jgi:hypothetical protein
MESLQSQAFSSISEKNYHIFCLCILLMAINETHRVINNVGYALGEAGPNANVTGFQVFLCQLAKICNFKKGGDTETALIVLKGPHGGPEYNIASNRLNERAEAFLPSLLTYVGTNPEGINEKPLLKRVLWKILGFNSLRIHVYLNKLLEALDECIRQCIETDAEESDIMAELKMLEERATFPQEIDTSATNNKYLSDCETLIKAIQALKANLYATKEIQDRASNSNQQKALPWCQLRHHMSRLHSYRYAAEIIVQAAKKWPDLFENFTFRWIPASKRTTSPILRDIKMSCGPQHIRIGALGEEGHRAYLTHLTDLRPHLDTFIEKHIFNIPQKTVVHGEVLLRHDLVLRGKTNVADFWHGSKFIATSKPPCRLCHFSFQDAPHGFEVQNSHQNIYLKWRLPDLALDAGPEIMEQREEDLDEICDLLYYDVVTALTDKKSQWRTNDSPTSSRGVTTATGGYSKSEMSDPRNFSRLNSSRAGYGVAITAASDIGGPSRMSSRSGHQEHQQRVFYSPDGAPLNEQDWLHVMEVTEEDEDDAV